MKRLCQLVVVILTFIAIGTKAHAAGALGLSPAIWGPLATCATLTAPSASSLQTALNSCGSGNTLALNPGTTSLGTTTINVPCGVSLVGPTVPYGANPYPIAPTAHLTGTGTAGWGFQYAAGGGCTTPANISYLEWNGGQPSAGGGGFLYIGTVVQSLTISYNYLHGNQANTVNAHDYDALIWVEGGSPNSATTPNSINIQWNVFGYSPNNTAASGDCGAISALFSYQGGTYDAVGGNCAAIGLHEVQLSNTYIQNNIIHWQEQGMKYFECGSSTPTECFYTNVHVDHNDISGYHRIAIESQISPSTTNTAGLTYDGNSVHNNINSSFGSWGFSQANIGYNYDLNNVMINENPPYLSGGAGGGTVANCPIGYNPPYCIPGAYEFWANQGNNSLIQGYWYSGYAWGYYFNTSQINNNTFAGYYMHNYGSDISNAHNLSPAPTSTGNVDAGATPSSILSTAPSISPGSGSQSFPLTVTITNAGFASQALPQGNMGNWCTTDGSTPTPGSGSAFYVASGGTFVMNSAGTANCKGMWGSQNQPVSYPAGYGFTPSANVSATYTGGTPTVATPVISPASGTYASTVNVTISDSTSGASLYYTTNGSTPTTSSTPYTGSFNVTPTATVKAIGALAGYTNSAVASATYTFGLPTVATPVPSPASETFSGQLTVSWSTSTAGATLYCTTDGSTPTTSSAVYSGPFTGIQATTTIKCIGALSGYNNSAVGTGVYTYTTPTLTSCSQANVGNVNTLTVGQSPIQQQVSATYNDGTHRTLPDTFGNNPAFSVFSGSTSYLNVTSSGLISCIAATPSGVTAYSEATGGTVGCSPWGWTCNSTPSLTSITLATTGGVSSIAYQATNQILAACHYSDGSTTSCNTTDSHGNVASSWTSSSGNVTISSSGLATAAVIGSSNLTAKAGGITSAALPLAVTSQKTLSGVTLTSAAGSSILVGATSQFHAMCTYSNASPQDCSVTDIYGDAVTSWGSSAAGVMSMSSSGLATGVSAGSANATAVVNGTVNATPFAMTVTNPSVTVTGISLATTGGVTGLFVGSTNQLIATCAYSDGSHTNCTATDSHGNVANTWTSTTPAHATVSTSGLATGVAPGFTTFTAKVGTFTSPALGLTVLVVPTGVYQIIITGPVKFSGSISF